jgi:hypothetical protein
MKTGNAGNAVAGHRKKQVKSLDIAKRFERDFTGTYMGRKIEIEDIDVSEELAKAANAPVREARNQK